jgi:hypothetical protein
LCSACFQRQDPTSIATRLTTGPGSLGPAIGFPDATEPKRRVILPGASAAAKPKRPRRPRTCQECAQSEDSERQQWAKTCRGRGSNKGGESLCDWGSSGLAGKKRKRAPRRCACCRDSGDLERRSQAQNCPGNSGRANCPFEKDT